MISFAYKFFYFTIAKDIIPLYSFQEFPYNGDDMKANERSLTLNVSSFKIIFFFFEQKIETLLLLFKSICIFEK